MGRYSLFVPLSDTVLNYLAQDDRELKAYFRGVFPADQLPPVSKKRVNAYIVNTDPAGEPGEHWLGIWTNRHTCEVFDSYGLPLSSYNNPTLKLGLNSGTKSLAVISLYKPWIVLLAGIMPYSF